MFSIGLPNSAVPVAGVDPEGMSVATRLTASEQVAVDWVCVLARAASEISTTALGAENMIVSPNSAAGDDWGLGVPIGAAPLVGSQNEPVTTWS